MKLKSFILIVSFCLFSFLIKAQITSLPHNQNFDSSTFPDEGWSVLATSTGIPALNMPAYSLQQDQIISAPNSLFAFIYPSATYVMLISPEILLDLSSVKINLQWRPAAANSRLEIGVLTNPTDASSFVPVTATLLPNPYNEWNDITVNFENYNGNGNYIGIKCTATTSGNHYIDNIEISQSINCQPVTNLQVENTIGTAALLTWNASASSSATSYTIQYAEAETNNWIAVNTTENSQLLTGLNEQTFYKARVITNCGSIIGDTSTLVSFLTTCNYFGGVNIGNGTATTDGGYIPLGLHFSYSASEQIFLASELDSVAQPIEMLSFQYNTAYTNSRDIQIFMGHTNLQSFTTIEDWIQASNLTKVYEHAGSLQNNIQNGYLYFILDTLFLYNGTDNLLILFLDRTASNSFYPDFQTHECTNNKSIRAAGNSYLSGETPYSTYSGLSNHRSNIRINHCITETCPRPQLLHASNITTDGMNLSWFGDTMDYIISYKRVHESIWNEISVSNAVSYSLSGLFTSSYYQFRVKKVCGDNEYSAWSDVLTVATNCQSIAIPYITDFENDEVGNLPACWSRLAADGTASAQVIATSAHSGSHALQLNQNDYAVFPSVHQDYLGYSLFLTFFAKATYDNMELNIGNFNIPNDTSAFISQSSIALTSAWTYYEMEVVSNNENQPLAFYWANAGDVQIDDISLSLMPDCLIPENLTANNITTSSVALTWTERNDATEWILECRQAGEENWTLHTITENPYTISNLISNTNYEVRVSSVCYTNSDWSQTVSFRTLSEIVNIPIICDFEDSTLFNKWVLINGNEPNQWFIGTAVNNTTNGNKSLYISQDQGINNSYNFNATSNVWAYMDINLDSTIGEYKISFDWHARGDAYSADYLLVYVGDTSIFPQAASSSISSSAMQLSGNLTRQENWQHAEYYLPQSFAGQVKRLFILWHNNNSAGANPAGAIDNIGIEATSCFRISNLHTDNISYNTTTFSWTTGGSETQWLVQYGLLDSTLADTIVTQSSFVLANLQENTNYQVVVAAYCGENAIGTAQTLNFTTLSNCTPISAADMPFEESFDNLLTDFPACWSRVPNTGYNAPHITTYQGETAMLLTTPFGSTNYTYLILPQVAADVSLSDYMVNFKMCFNTIQDILPVEIGILNSPNDTTNFVLVDSVNATSRNWTVYSQALNTYSGNGKYLAFRIQNALAGIFIDSLQLIQLPACNPPSELTYQNLTHNQVTISWTAASEEDHSWELLYKKQTDTSFISLQTTIPYINIPNLLEGTEYVVKVTTLCSYNRTSDYVSLVFTTSHRQFTITTIAGDHGTVSPSGSFTVTSGKDTTIYFFPDENYIISSIIVNGNNLSEIDSFYKIQNIDKNYVIRVDFMLNGIENFTTSNIHIYPNPATNQLRIKNHELQEGNLIEIYDILGQLQLSIVNQKSEIQTIDISTIAAGMYLLKIGNRIGKFVKE